MKAAKHQTHRAEETSPISRSGLRDQVAQRILIEVFERRFTSGSRLVVQRLAERFRVSPTPVREALVELAGLGIVELLPNRGAVVKPFGAEELRHISQVRRVLEMEAARSACGKIDVEVLGDLRDQLKQLRKMPQNDEWDRGSRAADSRLHLIIADHCGNPRLAQEIRRYLSLFRSVRNISHVRDSWNNYAHSNDVPDHLKIVEALLSNKAERAVRAIDSHIRSITEVLIAVVFTDPPPAAPTASQPMQDRRTQRARQTQ
jgi:DNA-binding GntR family transcriptional regulator